MYLYERKMVVRLLRVLKRVQDKYRDSDKNELEIRIWADQTKKSLFCHLSINAVSERNSKLENLR